MKALLTGGAFMSSDELFGFVCITFRAFPGNIKHGDSKRIRLTFDKALGHGLIFGKHQ